LPRDRIALPSMSPPDENDRHERCERLVVRAERLRRWAALLGVILRTTSKNLCCYGSRTELLIGWKN